MPSTEMTGQMTEVSIARDYTRYPGGRYRKHGKGSGQEFREDHLEPMLREGSEVTVLLDGVAGYPASFLEEAFGGLIRSGLSFDSVREHLTIEANDPVYRAYATKAWQYIEDQARKN
jgi:hypothetical protein